MRKEIKNGDNIIHCSLDFAGTPGQEGSGLVYTCKAVGTIKQMTNTHIIYTPFDDGKTVKIARNQFRSSEGKSKLGIVRGMKFNCYTPSEELCKNLCIRAAHEIREKSRIILETQQKLMGSLMQPIAGLEDDLSA